MCLLVVLLKANYEDANFNLSSKRFLIIYQSYQPKTTKLVISKTIANLLDFFFLLISRRFAVGALQMTNLFLVVFILQRILG